MCLYIHIASVSMCMYNIKYHTDAVSYHNVFWNKMHLHR